MNTGKSISLISKFYHETLINKNVVETFTYKNDSIGSRSGLAIDSRWYDENTDFKFLDYVDIILIDEAQFLSLDQILDLILLVTKHNIEVICYGLRTDFRGIPFVGSTYLLAWSSTLKEIEAVNVYKEKIGFQIRLDKDGNRLLDGPQIEIGNNYKGVSLQEFDMPLNFKR